MAVQRMVVLDTETTGLSPEKGHRVLEIGCVELMDLHKTGHVFQTYINPDRDIPEEVIRVHGITKEKVSDAPRFQDIADTFLAFLGNDSLVIHNAGFDLAFLNAELKQVGRTLLDGSRVTDTLMMARRRFPGAANNLNALCRRLKVDNSHRVLHGALLDASILADVYVALKGGRQFQFSLFSQDQDTDVSREKPSSPEMETPVCNERVAIPARHWTITPEEEQNHLAFLEKIQEASGGECLWLQAG